MAARLKVFGWSDGFHSFTVATSSRPKALAAWGVEQDLFRTGLAHEIEEGPEHDAALAAPGTVIRTDKAIDPSAGAPAAGKAEAASRQEQARRRKAEARVAELQSRLDALDTESTAELRSLEARRDALDRDIEAARARDAKARAALKASLRDARRAV